MNAESSLIYQTFDNFLWVRCTARGSFLNSPILKSIADKYIADGGHSIVLDLEICLGVDSTFMGTLAGIARQCSAHGGALEIASPTERTKTAMMNLGLDNLLDIDPANAIWLPQLDDIRKTLELQESGPEATATSASSAKAMSETDRARHVLEAHTTLRDLNDKNKDTFGYVCESLEEDIKRREEE